MEERARGNTPQSTDLRGMGEDRTLLRMLLVASNRIVSANGKRNSQIGKSRDPLAWTTAGPKGLRGLTLLSSLLGFSPLCSVLPSP